MACQPKSDTRNPWSTIIQELRAFGLLDAPPQDFFVLGRFAGPGTERGVEVRTVGTHPVQCSRCRVWFLGQPQGEMEGRRMI